LDKFLRHDQNNNINFEKLLNILKDYEMIMIGFKNQKKIIDKDLVKEILKIRKQKPIFFVDCGIPGNISMDVGMLDNCFLFDLNDLEQLYSSWIENNQTNEDTNNELYDLELKNLLDNFFKRLDLNLNQKMVFEQKINSLLKSSGNEIKLNLKKLLRAFK
jgi:glutamyl-tRNA reductase